MQEITRVVQAAFGLGKLVIVDKSFQDFLLDSSEYTVRPLLADYSNLLILQSLTKLFALPGLRLGCMFASAKITSGPTTWGESALKC